MRRAVKGWAAREGGARLDDLSLAWRVLDEPEGLRRDGVEVFMAHASKQKVDDAMAEFESCGSRPRLLLPGYLVLDRYIRALHPAVEGLKAWSFIHLDEDGGFLCVSTNRCLLLHRSLPRDLSGGAEEDAYADRLATEVLRSVQRSRQSQANLEIGAILISGDRRVGERLASALAAAQKADISTWSIADLVEIDDPSSEGDLTIPVAAAVVASLESWDFNLLPKRRKGSLSTAATRRIAIAAAVMAGILLPLAVGGGLVARKRSLQRLRRARADMEALQPSIDSARRADRIWRGVVDRERVISEHERAGGGLERVLSDLALRTPAQVRLENLKVLRRGGKTLLQLSGESRDDKHADAQKAVLDFVASLDESKYLERSRQTEKLTIGETGGDGTWESEGDSLMAKKVLFSLEFRIDLGESEGS